MIDIFANEFEECSGPYFLYNRDDRDELCKIARQLSKSVIGDVLSMSSGTVDSVNRIIDELTDGMDLDRTTKSYIGWSASTMALGQCDFGRK